MHEHTITSTATPSTSSRGRPTFPRRATIRPWIDATVDQRGHDPRSLYVEQFWLGVLGPTSTWLLRRLVAGLDEHPSGYLADFDELAGGLGLSTVKGRTSPFGRALHRCVMFDAARPLRDGTVGWEVRRRLPTVAQRHLRRLPVDVQRMHAEWDHSVASYSGIERAHRLATAMVEAGDDPALVERQLVAVGVSPHAASMVTGQLLTSS